MINIQIQPKKKAGKENPTLIASMPAMGCLYTWKVFTSYVLITPIAVIANCSWINTIVFPRIGSELANDLTVFKQHRWIGSVIVEGGLTGILIAVVRILVPDAVAVISAAVIAVFVVDGIGFVAVSQGSKIGAIFGNDLSTIEFVATIARSVCPTIGNNK